MPKALVIDDDRSIHVMVRKILGPIAEVISAEQAGEGLGLLQETEFDVVLLDIRLPDRSGMAVLSEIQQHDRRLPVIFMTIEATSETAIEAMRLGAYDYLAKPLVAESLRDLVARAIEQRALSSVPVAIAADDAQADRGGELFVGRSPSMLEVFKAIGRVSNQNIPVLIRGESGTGKELVARALFHHGDRQDGPFLAVNCAALPDNLLESELFGHEKGAFTGAESRRIGKFEQCHGGTLFLDEVGDMAPIVQAKVLRVLQEQRFERLGGGKELLTDCRIVAATNQSLEQMVREGDYREDLLYRLNGVTIELPPLRQRRSDIPLLTQYFLSQAKRDMGKQELEGLAPEAVEWLTSYDWPGNVRQLRSVIRRCVLDSVLPVITPDVLPDEVTGRRGRWSSDPPAGDDRSPGTAVVVPVAPREGAGLPELVDDLLERRSTNLYAEAMEYMERYVLMRVLRETEGNQSQAAEILGITRGKLRDRIQTYGIRLDNEVTIGAPTAASG